MQDTGWYYEFNGQMNGPYTSSEVRQFILDGKLKVETKIYHPESNLWKIAADIIPEMEISFNTATSYTPSAQQHSHARTGWQPPPRPANLNEVHIYESTGTPLKIDYFELVNLSKKNTQAAQKIQTKTSNNDFVEETKISNDRKTFTPEVIVNNDIEAFESDSIFKKYSRPIAYAASITVVFAATFGIVRYVSSQSKREIASTAKEKSVVQKALPVSNPPQASSTDQTNIKMPSSTAIGTGQSQVKRNSGSVSKKFQPAMSPTLNQNAEVNQNVQNQDINPDQNADHMNQVQNPPPSNFEGDYDRGVAGGVMNPNNITDGPVNTPGYNAPQDPNSMPMNPDMMNPTDAPPVNPEQLQGF